MKKNFDISLWEKIINSKYNSREEKRKQILEITKEKLKVYFFSTMAAEVYLTGSLLRENSFYDFSDIDIAVSGLEKDYLKTKSELENLINRTVDLIELEKCGFKKIIKKNGYRIL